MLITSISLSYFFLGVFIIAIGFSLYFKALVINTSPDSKKREKILGDMKDPISWRDRNNKMAYLAMFWSAISLILFIYLKFFYNANLISIIYLFVYLALIAVSTILFGGRRKASI